MSLLKSKWLYAGAVVAAVLQTGILYASIEKRASGCVLVMRSCCRRDQSILAI